MITDHERSRQQLLGKRFALDLTTRRRSFNARELPEAGRAEWVGQLRGVDDELGFGGSASAHLHRDSWYSIGRHPNLARVKSGVDQPASCALESLHVCELVC